MISNHFSMSTRTLLLVETVVYYMCEVECSQTDRTVRYHPTGVRAELNHLPLHVTHFNFTTNWTFLSSQITVYFIFNSSVLATKLHFLQISIVVTPSVLLHLSIASPHHMSGTEKISVFNTIIFKKKLHFKRKKSVFTTEKCLVIFKLQHEISICLPLNLTIKCLKFSIVDHKNFKPIVKLKNASNLVNI